MAILYAVPQPYNLKLGLWEKKWKRVKEVEASVLHASLAYLYFLQVVYLKYYRQMIVNYVNLSARITHGQKMTVELQVLLNVVQLRERKKRETFLLCLWCVENILIHWVKTRLIKHCNFVIISILSAMGANFNENSFLKVLKDKNKLAEPFLCTW